MKPVREVVSREIIDDLWGAGYTILPRRRHPDPFFVPPEMVPTTRSYQWWHLVHDKIHYERPPGAQSSGWSPVPASRHDGYFMPAGFVGDIEVSGLGLFEKSKVEVDQDRAQQIAAAQQQSLDWAKNAGATGITGHVKVGYLGDEQKIEIGPTHTDPDTKTIETTVRIPRDMQPHVVAIFAERDRMAAEFAKEAESYGPIFSCKTYEDAHEKLTKALEANPDEPKWPFVHALLLPRAIENVRKQLKEAPDAT